MTTPFHSNYNETIPFSDICGQIALATNTAQTYTVPGTANQKYQAIFGYASNSNVFVGYNVTATSPTAGTSTTTSSLEFKPDKRYVKGGDEISLITPDSSAYVGVSLLSLPS